MAHMAPGPQLNAHGLPHPQMPMPNMPVPPGANQGPQSHFQASNASQSQQIPFQQQFPPHSDSERAWMECQFNQIQARLNMQDGQQYQQFQDQNQNISRQNHLIDTLGQIVQHQLELLGKNDKKQDETIRLLHLVLHSETQLLASFPQMKDFESKTHEAILTKMQSLESIVLNETNGIKRGAPYNINSPNQSHSIMRQTSPQVKGQSRISMDVTNESPMVHRSVSDASGLSTMSGTTLGDSISAACIQRHDSPEKKHAPSQMPELQLPMSREPSPQEMTSEPGPSPVEASALSSTPPRVRSTLNHHPPSPQAVDFSPIRPAHLPRDSAFDMPVIADPGVDSLFPPQVFRSHTPVPTVPPSRSLSACPTHSARSPSADENAFQSSFADGLFDEDPNLDEQPLSISSQPQMTIEPDQSWNNGEDDELEARSMTPLSPLTESSGSDSDDAIPIVRTAPRAQSTERTLMIPRPSSEGVRKSSGGRKRKLQDGVVPNTFHHVLAQPPVKRRRTQTFKGRKLSLKAKAPLRRRTSHKKVEVEDSLGHFEGMGIHPDIPIIPDEVADGPLDMPNFLDVPLKSEMPTRIWPIVPIWPPIVDDKDAQYDGEAECSLCERWFHFRCVNEDPSKPEFRDGSDLPWYCPWCSPDRDAAIQAVEAHPITEEENMSCGRPHCDIKTFEIDRIIGKRTWHRDGAYVMRWLTTWSGYPMNESTWQPISSFPTMKQLFVDFNEALEMEGKDPDTDCFEVLLREAEDAPEPQPWRTFQLGWECAE